MPLRRTSTDLFERVRVHSKGLLGIEEGTCYGTPALRVKKKFMARLHDNGEWLVLKLDFPSRDDLLRRNPKLFFTTDHYRGYPTVLIHLSLISDGQLQALLEDAWRLLAPKSLLREEIATPSSVSKKRTKPRRPPARGPRGSS